MPSAGIHFALEKLYANQADEDASVSIPYASDFGATLGQLVALLGTACFWAGLWLAWRPVAPVDPRHALLGAGGGLILLLVPIGYLPTSATPPLVLSVLALVGVAAWHSRVRLWPAKWSASSSSP